MAPVEPVHHKAQQSLASLSHPPSALLRGTQRLPPATHTVPARRPGSRPAPAQQVPGQSTSDPSVSGPARATTPALPMVRFALSTATLESPSAPQGHAPPAPLEQAPLVSALGATHLRTGRAAASPPPLLPNIPR